MRGIRGYLFELGKQMYVLPSLPPDAGLTPFDDMPTEQLSGPFVERLDGGDKRGGARGADA